MAADTACSDDYQFLTKVSKIVRLASGGLFGSSGDGDVRDAVELVTKIKTPAGLPTRKQLLTLELDFSGILVLPKGRIFHVYADEPDDHTKRWSAGVYEISEDFFAVGSGATHAIAAMEAGKSAKDAVHIACRRDLYTRAPVHVMALVPKKPA